MLRWMDGMRIVGAVVLAAMFWAGCETTTLENQGPVTLGQLQGTPEAPAEGEAPAPANPGSPSGGGGGGWPGEITGSIRWLHTDVSGWAVTSGLNASVGGGTISMPYDKARVWPAVGGLNANPWVLVNLNGQWYAATFEWFRFGQTSKPTGVLDGRLGDHIKVSPLNSWRPRSGERIGLMVSGLARSTQRNVRERTNVSMVTWP